MFHGLKTFTQELRQTMGGCPGVPVHEGIPIVFITIHGVMTQFVNVSFFCVPVHEDTTDYGNLKYFIELKHSILIPLPINHIYAKYPKGLFTRNWPSRIRQILTLFEFTAK